MNKTHGKSRTSTYKRWTAMMQRCLNPLNSDYADYGARGITICDKWLTFEGFYADMGEKPPGKSLGRIDNFKGYSKDNCRWETPTEQQNNRRVNTFVVFGGISKTLSQWALSTGIDRGTLWCRLSRGWSLEKTFTTKVSKSRHY